MDGKHRRGSGRQQFGRLKIDVRDTASSPIVLLTALRESILPSKGGSVARTRSIPERHICVNLPSHDTEKSGELRT
jgi:hypothetical protein